jgi:hypothetical protein
VAEEGPQERLVIADSEEGELGLHHEVDEFDRGEVGQWIAFGVTQRWLRLFRQKKGCR